ncbi:hypothetical protein ACOSP7_032257 [Xanthoceras sorbifolium]
MRDELAIKCPKREHIINYTLDKHNRHFFSDLYIQMLRNGETCDRKWLVYSKELDRVFCFCCKLFKVIHSRSQLAKEGIRDWKHVSEKLTQHENCLVHLTNMRAWSELIKRLGNSQTIHNIELERIRNDQLY